MSESLCVKYSAIISKFGMKICHWRSFFGDIQNTRGTSYQLRQKADNFYQVIDYSGYHTNRI